MLNELKHELFKSLGKHFPEARIESKEKRGIVLTLRAYVRDDIFIEVYCNILTGKKSFALIIRDTRISGYDNFKYWHYHPPYKPDKHIACEEPTIDYMISSFKDIIGKNL